MRGSVSEEAGCEGVIPQRERGVSGGYSALMGLLLSDTHAAVPVSPLTNIIRNIGVAFNTQ